jgi:ketosteroid isomerase-like protein
VPLDDVATVKQAFDAFAARDLARLQALSSEGMVLENAITGSVIGQQRYEGRGAIARYLADVDEVWGYLEIRPRTFHSTRPGQVLVSGTVLARRSGATHEVAAAWSWDVLDGKIVSIRVLPAVEASELAAPPAR